MAGIPVVTAGQQPTADELNLGFMIGAAVFRAYASTSQTITTGTETASNACLWDTPDLDRLSAWSSSTKSRWTAPFAGWWTLAGSVSFNGNVGGTQRDACWFINGGNISGGRARTFAESSIANVPLSVEARTFPLFMAAGDYAELIPVHNVGSSILTATGTLAPYMSVHYSGPG